MSRNPYRHTMDYATEITMEIKDIEINGRDASKFFEDHDLFIRKGNKFVTPNFREVFTEKEFEPTLKGELTFVIEPPERDVNYAGGIEFEDFDGEMYVGLNDNGEDAIEWLGIANQTYYRIDRNKLKRLTDEQRKINVGRKSLEEMQNEVAEPMNNKQFVKQILTNTVLEFTGRSERRHQQMLYLKFSIEPNGKLTGKEFHLYNTDGILEYIEEVAEEEAWNYAEDSDDDYEYIH